VGEAGGLEPVGLGLDLLHGHALDPEVVERAGLGGFSNNTSFRAGLSVAKFA
jgi:hypothetical protein